MQLAKPVIDFFLSCRKRFSLVALLLGNATGIEGILIMYLVQVLLHGLLHADIFDIFQYEQILYKRVCLSCIPQVGVELLQVLEFDYDISVDIQQVELELVLTFLRSNLRRVDAIILL